MEAMAGQWKLDRTQTCVCHPHGADVSGQEPHVLLEAMDFAIHLHRSVAAQETALTIRASLR